MTGMSWHDASARLKAGDKVRFDTSHDIFPECLVPEGATATVVENSLNEACALLELRPDDTSIREALKNWDGNILLSPESYDAFRDGAAWHDCSPIEMVTS